MARPGTGPAERRRAQAGRMANLTLNGIVAELNLDGLIPAKLEARSLRGLADEPIPAVK